MKISRQYNNHTVFETNFTTKEERVDICVPYSREKMRELETDMSVGNINSDNCYIRATVPVTHPLVGGKSGSKLTTLVCK